MVNSLLFSRNVKFHHSYKQFENIDGLAYKYYKDATLAWVIMAANPDLFMEFQVKPGTQIRSPFPLSRCWSFLGANGEI